METNISIRPGEFKERVNILMKNKTKKTQDLDFVLGNKIFLLRKQKNMSRNALAQLVGVTHQQVAKYENGTNRISVSRLVLISKALEVEMNYFFGEFIIVK